MMLPFVLALLLPLAACAAQPTAPSAPAASEGAAVAQAPAASSQAAAPIQAPVLDPRQPDASAQDNTTAAPRPGAATPAPRTAPGSATGTPPSIPAAERASTAGELPAAAGSTTPAPGAASMPAAPGAIPGTPADQARMPQAAAAPSAAPSAGSLLQTILALALVLALLAALAWAMKRYGPKMSGNSANLRMVGAMNIGGRERIMVVEVGDQWIVVGASPGRVNALATMPKGEGAQTAQSTATLAGHTPSAATFADWLKQTIDKRNAK